ncbi:MAG: hypothetical protein HY866_05950, partial [Chloroflexi bacterium]|nr:hypothetical protein [Chloroflexota bacterium]
MQPTTNGTAAVSFLDDIKRLFEGGDREEAFDLLDSYLGENPKDVEAELLKVELCLKTERDLVFVGQTLPRLEDHLPGDERIPELRIQAEEKVRQRLTDGRRATRRRYWSDAARYFDSAVNLAPDDPSVALAAGMAMIGAEPASNFEDDDEGSSGPLRSLLGSRSSSAAPKPETSVRYFQLALDRSTAGEPVYTLAAEQLIKHWLGRNKIDEVLQLLEKLPPSENKLHDLAATTAHQMISRALDAAARFL